uniref:Sulfur globule protein CV1 n=1 Tax=Candidatus Kentrum sp. SD TaxID=2126332 RepID=A0A450YN80_9GAMM|nr:MAG: hypothetical protein BECKSD772F_GA0070984_11331 [Candidatus Kentron sp. SD]VFK48509.1 MAG: hypothetical protein BECKSD772E_GA0070983_11287 [Candidatus Kentron sp. SD]VFK80371.1 MAG: hypothetical protein BECKSD772D_GA0070982_11078 [Candidatus Kentron sp. SD]
MKLVSKTIATALIVGASALPMQSANAFFMSPDGHGNFGPWNMSEFGMSNRGGGPWGGGYGGGYGGYGGYGGGHGGYGGAPYGGFPSHGYGAPYHPAAPGNFYGYGVPYRPAAPTAPAQSPAK